MRFLSIALVMTAALQLVAAETTEQKKIYPVPPSKMAEFNAKTGGLVEPPQDAKTVVILDARSVDVPSMRNFADSAERMVSIGCDIKPIKIATNECPRAKAFVEKKAGAGAVILFYERADDPVLSAYPEDAVVLVNLEPLKCDDANKFSRRFSKEFWRSIGFALGGYGNPSQMGTSLQPAFSVADLDAINGFGLVPAQIASIASVKSKLGIYGRKAVPYSRAAREGWAPTPTNDVQRSLYQRFKDPTSRFKTDFGK